MKLGQKYLIVYFWVKGWRKEIGIETNEPANVKGSMSDVSKIMEGINTNLQN